MPKVPHVERQLIGRTISDVHHRDHHRMRSGAQRVAVLKHHTRLRHEFPGMVTEMNVRSGTNASQSAIFFKNRIRDGNMPSTPSVSASIRTRTPTAGSSEIFFAARFKANRMR